MTTAIRVLGVCVALALVIATSGNCWAAGEDQGYLGVQIKANPNGDGIIIVAFQADAPGEKGGLKEQDIIVEANGKKVTGVQQFVETVRDTKPGETIELKLLRGATEMELKIKVGKRPVEPPPAGK
jgi:S1-C subfamily serine protease